MKVYDFGHRGYGEAMGEFPDAAAARASVRGKEPPAASPARRAMSAAALAAVRIPAAAFALAAALILAAAVGAASPASAFAGEGTGERISGDDRYETAAAISAEAFPDGAAYAILTTGGNFPDALGASALAGLLDCPVLLTQTDALSDDASAELSRLGAKTVLIVGGESAVSPQAEASVRASGVSVERIAGNDRYATALEVYTWGAKHGSWGGTAIVTTGGKYPDALSASGYAYATKSPVFLCNPESGLGVETAAAIGRGGFSRAIVLGGTSAVSDSAKDAVSSLIAGGGDAVQRIGGTDRYATSGEFAEFVQSELGTAGTPCVASGANFPDALAGCSLAGRNGGLMLLGAVGETAAFGALSNGSYSALYYLGGTGALPASVTYAAETAAGWHTGGGTDLSGQRLTADDIAVSGTISNAEDGGHAIVADGVEKSYANIAVTKTGSSDGDEADFYGENAAVFATNGAALELSDIILTSSGKHANGVFSYGEGTEVSVSHSLIKTSGNCSGGLMTTGGGTTTASDVTAETTGNSSAAIRSDRGGGTVSVTGGYFTTAGTGSPAIYSTADITATRAYLKSDASQGVVVEGKNSVALNGCELIANHSKQNGDHSDTRQAVMLYQSMSGDASVGTSGFAMNGGTLTNKKGDIFFVTNTTATIELTGATITNEDEDGIFLRAAAAGWGKTGSNGGKVTLDAQGQSIAGDMLVDGVSSLALSLADGSSFVGAVNPSGDAGSVSVEIEAGSTWTLTGDSYISSLSCAAGTIDTNGHTLYVGGTEYTGGAC